MNKSGNVTISKPKLPVLLQVSATIIIVIGIIGFLFFTVASLYQYYNPNFLYYNSDASGFYMYLNVYIVILAILHIVLCLSGFLILKLKKVGFYLFFFDFLLLLASEIILENKLILAYIIVGLILVFILLIYYRRFV